MVIDTILQRGSRNGGLPTGTALFSFEGTNLIPSSTLAFDSSVKPLPQSRMARNEASRREIFENCIEKNFHVSQHESGHQNLHLTSGAQAWLDGWI